MKGTLLDMVKNVACVSSQLDISREKKLCLEFYTLAGSISHTVIRLHMLSHYFTMVYLSKNFSPKLNMILTYSD